MFEGLLFEEELLKTLEVSEDEPVGPGGSHRPVAEGV